MGVTADPLEGQASFFDEDDGPDEPRRATDPEKTANVHLGGPEDLRKLEEALDVQLWETTRSFWYLPDGEPERLVGRRGMEFGPAPSDDDSPDDGMEVPERDMFGERVQERWRDHWVGMPEFEMEDRTPWKTITVKFLREEDAEWFEMELGVELYHDKWTWYPERGYSSWTDQVWAGGPPEPKYPIYIPSKGRADNATTMKALDRLGVSYRIVVEPQEVEQYAERFGEDPLVVLPDDLPDGLHTTRTWIKRHSIRELGAERHWQIDDNISAFHRLHRNAKRHVADGAAIFRAAEDFVDRYQQVALAGFQYEFFAPRREEIPPYYLNTRIYSCTLVNNSIPHEWETYFNDDTDISLRVMKDGWRTVLFNAFLAKKIATMRKSGGLTEEYEATDNRREFAEELKERHPELVEITKKWGRWHHDVNYSPFQGNRLRPKDGVNLDELPDVDEYGMELKDADEVGYE